jgi:opacity protein-like surface antigen
MLILSMLAALAVGEADALPRSLSAAEPAAGDSSIYWTIGPRLGYIDPKDGDSTWLIGVQSRLHIFPWLAVEGAVDFHKEEFSDDIEIWTVPITFSGLVYLPVDWKIRPYAVAGFGWYVMNTHFKDDLSSQDDETSSEFGVHLGVGADWSLTERLSIDASFRYLFLDEPPNVGAANFDAWEIVIGVNFRIG